MADIQNFALRAHCVHGIPNVATKDSQRGGGGGQHGSITPDFTNPPPPRI